MLGWSVVGLVTRDDAATRGPSEPGEIVISDFAFLPGTQAVAVGAVLTWSNSDSAAHTVDTNDQQLDSGSIARGETFEHTFATPGTFEYFCAFHPFMKGVVEVTR